MMSGGARSGAQSPEDAAKQIDAQGNPIPAATEGAPGESGVVQATDGNTIIRQISQPIFDPVLVQSVEVLKMKFTTLQKRVR